VSFPVDFFFPSALGEKKQKKEKRKKEKRKKEMEGEVLGQANYPYIVLGGSLVMCIAVILMGFKM
jgi:glutaredoxin